MAISDNGASSLLCALSSWRKKAGMALIWLSVSYGVAGNNGGVSVSADAVVGSGGG